MLALLLTAALAGTALADTIKIGAIYNLTGGQASLDQPSLNGFQMAADEINAAGGIGGATVEVVAIDGKTEQDAVANAVTKMVDVDKVVVVAAFPTPTTPLAAA